VKARFPRRLSLIALILTNIAILGNVNNWPIFGSSGILSLFFFIPSILVTAELASTWHQEGGLYMWVKKAFGHRAAFTAAWLIWLQAMFWFPLPLVILASSSALLFHSSWGNHTFYQLIFVLVLLWITTFVFFQGIRVHSRINAFGALFGILLMGVLTITFGIIWILKGYPLAFTFSFDGFMRDIGNVKNWSILSGIMTTVVGIEMSAFHAPSVKNPQKNYPRAAFISSPISYTLAFFGTLAILSVVGQSSISLFQNDVDVLQIFFNSFPIPGLFPFALVLFIIGLYVEMNAWYAAPIKGILAIANHGDLPPVFRHTNSRGMPTTLMILQALIVSVLSILYILFPNVNYIYWIFIAFVIMLYLIVYLIIFAAVIKLRYSNPHVNRPYQIPGGKIGIWLIAGLGFTTSLAIFILSFLLPEYVLNFSSLIYFPWFVLGLSLFCLLPQFILLFKKASWKSELVEEIETQVTFQACKLRQESGGL